MSSFDLDTIRHAISSRMQQGRLVLSNPSAIVAALATTALFSLLPEGTLSQPLLDSILINIVGGGLGVSALYDFLKGFIDNLQQEEENQYSADEIRQRFEQALLERLEESGHTARARVLRADVSRLLRHVEGINVALSAAPSDLRQPLVDSLIELGSNFEEFRWILIEQSQLLVEIQKRSQDIMSDVQRLVRQVVRLEQNQQALPAKLKLLLLLQSERSASDDATPSPPAAGTSPYKGLPAFQKDDADYFFGREEQVVDLIHQLAQDKRFLAVIGPSGSGKSSLVRAGLLSQLDSNTAHQLLHSRDWRTVIVKPGDHPIAALANSVGSLSINIGSRALLRGLQDSPDELARAIRQQLLHNQPLHVRLLLIVDQFEELFTRCRDESERLRFIESLLHVSQSTACRTIVLLTMRADFYGHCASHPRLRSQIQDHHLLVGPLHESELRRVIELPANKAGLQLEPGLTETIIKDVADAPGALPLLSQALLETWKRRQDTTLTRSGYEASGGVQQAIAQTADKVYNEQLTSEQQAIARQIFLRLVELGESEQYDSRRRTSRSELGDGASEVLLKLADARLIVTDQPSLNPSQQWEGSVEVAHEALIREWPTLRHWLDDDREGLRIHRHLTEAAQEWEQLGRDTGDLYRGARLAQAREWAEQHPNDLNALEQELLQASQQAVEEARREREEMLRREAAAERKAREEAEKREREQKRANTQWRRLAAVLAVVFLVAVGIAFYANTKAEEAVEAQATADVARDEADQNAEEAREAQATAEEAARKESEARKATEKQNRIAMAGQLVAQSQSALEDYPQRSLLLAVEALQATMRENEPRVPAAEQALRDALANIGGIGLSSQEGGLSAIAISPDNNWLVTSSFDNTARLWDLTANDPAASPIVLTGHESHIEAVAFSPDNHWLVTGSFKEARLWDLTTNDVAATPIVLTGHENSIWAVAISPDNHWLVTASGDKTARLWDLTANDPAASPIVLTGHEYLIEAVAFSPDNHWLVTANFTEARLWDLTANNPAANPIVLTGHEGIVSDIAISADNHWLVTASFKEARLWDLTANDPAASPIVLTGHEYSIEAVAFSADNHWLVTGSSDRTARLWDLTANNPAASPIVLTGHEGPINAVAISADNHWLVTASGDRTARLWDLTANNPAASFIVLTGHESSIEAVAISQDNHWLVTVGSDDKTPRLWDLTANNPAASSIVLTGHESSIEAVAISQDNHWLVTGSSDGTARLWDLTANNPTASPFVLNGHEDSIRVVAISPNNHWLVTASSLDNYEIIGHFDDTARLWDLTANNPSASPIVLTGHEKWIGAVAISPDNHWLVTGSGDKTARLWDLTANNPAAAPIVLTGHEDSITKVAISLDNHWLVTASDDKTARLWDLTANDLGASAIVLTGHEGNIFALAISPDNHWLVTVSSDETARLWDLTANDPAANSIVLTGHERSINAVAISPDNHWLVTSSRDATARLWDLTANDPAATPILLSGHEDGINAVAISPDNRWLVTGSGDLTQDNSDNTARLWDLTANDPAASSIVLTGHEGSIRAVAISLDNHWLVTASDDKTARLWDLTANEPAATSIVLTGHEGNIFALAISPDNHWLVTVSSDNTARLWNLTANDPAASPIVLARHEDLITEVAISPDNHWLVTASSDNTARLWDLTANVPAASPIVLTGHEGGIFALAISPDNHWLVTGSWDNTARLWNLRLDELSQLACRTAGRDLSQEEWTQYFGEKEYRKTCPDLPVHWSVEQEDE